MDRREIALTSFIVWLQLLSQVRLYLSHRDLPFGRECVKRHRELFLAFLKQEFRRRGYITRLNQSDETPISDGTIRVTAADSKGDSNPHGPKIKVTIPNNHGPLASSHKKGAGITVTLLSDKPPVAPSLGWPVDGKTTDSKAAAPPHFTVRMPSSKDNARVAKGFLEHGLTPGI